MQEYYKIYVPCSKEELLISRLEANHKTVKFFQCRAYKTSRFRCILVLIYMHMQIVSVSHCGRYGGDWGGYWQVC